MELVVSDCHGSVYWLIVAHDEAKRSERRTDGGGDASHGVVAWLVGVLVVDALLLEGVGRGDQSVHDSWQV